MYVLLICNEIVITLKVQNTVSVEFRSVTRMSPLQKQQFTILISFLLNKIVLCSGFNITNFPVQEWKNESENNERPLKIFAWCTRDTTYYYETLNGTKWYVCIV